MFRQLNNLLHMFAVVNLIFQKIHSSGVFMWEGEKKEFLFSRGKIGNGKMVINILARSVHFNSIRYTKYLGDSKLYLGWSTDLALHWKRQFWNLYQPDMHLADRLICGTSFKFLILPKMFPINYLDHILGGIMLASFRQDFILPFWL